jgi:hypothetical protein
MTRMGGAVKALLAGGMLMRDAGGVCCSIIYGQDNRSPIATQPTGAFCVAYAPAEQVEAHLRRIVEKARLFSLGPAVEQLRMSRAE